MLRASSGKNLRPRNVADDRLLSLEEKVARHGGRSGYSFDDENKENLPRGSGTKHGSQSKQNADRNICTGSSDPLPGTASRVRIFENPSGIRKRKMKDSHFFTPIPLHPTSTLHTDPSSFSSEKSIVNPYKAQKYRGRELRAPNTSFGKRGTTSHIVCAVSENIARETCVTSMDAGCPVVLTVSKQGNGLTYAETMAYLKYLQPDEVLLNEGRKNSQLVQKIMEHYNTNASLVEDSDIIESTYKRSNRGNSARYFDRQRTDRTPVQKSDSCCRNNATIRLTNASKQGPTQLAVIKTVVKFVPRSYFDQSKGAELVNRVTRQGSYDSSILEEYILLSCSNALLQYMQLCLGAYFGRSSVEFCLNSGSTNRMAIDRSSILHLEILANTKTGKIANSLIGTLDCTKTSVGSRLFRSNLLAPPTRVETINARLDLVDIFLEDEEFFYEAMSQLEALPDINKMMAHMALIPNQNQRDHRKPITARMASKGIGALVCIKSTLLVVQNLARVLEVQFKSLRDRMRQLDSDAKSLIDEQSILSETSDLSSVTESLVAHNHSSNKCNSVPSCQKKRSSNNTLFVGLGGSSFHVNGKHSRYQLLQAIICALTNPALIEILDSVTDIFTESTLYCKNSHAMRHQECFALKPNTDGIMDILRKTYLANVDDIYKLADEYAETYGTTVAVKETTARGYFLSIPSDRVSELPNIFIQPVKNGKFIHCTTEDVHSLNTRAQENVQDLLLMTHDRIQDVINIARMRYDSLASLSDAIALLDLCHSFADNVVSDRLPWCRPIVTNNSQSMATDIINSSRMNEAPSDSTVINDVVSSGTLAIKNGRFGIDVKTAMRPKKAEATGSDATYCFIPNDTYASSFQNFTIITGVNGSGKSTYLKQIAIVVILAHCGSYVPAEEAFIPVRDRICTRLGISDDQEHNISSFLQEMKDTAFICNYATDRSLILIDELGRATSNEDGVAIAWAIAEYLLGKRALTFFVTHYTQLCTLSDIYPNVQNHHLGSVVSGEDVHYTRKILPGPCEMSLDYGITMCASCGWERSTYDEAQRIHTEIRRKLPDGVIGRPSSSNDNSVIDTAWKQETVINKLAHELGKVKYVFGCMANDARRKYLQTLCAHYLSSDLELQMHQMMKRLLQDDVAINNAVFIDTLATETTDRDGSSPVNNSMNETAVIIKSNSFDELKSSSFQPSRRTALSVQNYADGIGHVDLLCPASDALNDDGNISVRSSHSSTSESHDHSSVCSRRSLASTSSDSDSGKSPGCSNGRCFQTNTK